MGLISRIKNYAIEVDRELTDMPKKRWRWLVLVLFMGVAWQLNSLRVAIEETQSYAEDIEGELESVRSRVSDLE